MTMDSDQVSPSPPAAETAVPTGSSPTPPTGPAGSGSAAPPVRKRRRRFRMLYAAVLIASGRSLEETAALIDYSPQSLRDQLWHNTRFRREIEANRRLLADETAWRLQAQRARLAKAIAEEIEKGNWQVVKWLADRLHLEHVPPAEDPQGKCFAATPALLKFHGRYSPEQLNAKSRPETMVVISDDI